jgi:large subunit ribosomal protein L21
VPARRPGFSSSRGEIVDKTDARPSLGAATIGAEGCVVGIRKNFMFAVIKTGGKQYKVAAEDVIKIEKIEGEAGDPVAFTEVLMVGTTIGAPHVAGATVAGEIVEQTRGPKVISFKKRRRQNSKRKRGHRQDLTMVKITEILTGGAKPSAAAKPAKVADAAAPAADGAVSEDVELIAGIGPTIKKKLNAAGITTWKQVAAWTAEDLAKYDEELALRGRATREEWIEQAKELLAGKPPRAKVDQAKAKDAE